MQNHILLDVFINQLIFNDVEAFFPFSCPVWLDQRWCEIVEKRRGVELKLLLRKSRYLQREGQGQVEQG